MPLLILTLLMLTCVVYLALCYNRLVAARHVIAALRAELDSMTLRRESDPTTFDGNTWADRLNTHDAAVRLYNLDIAQFPAVLVAKLCRFEPAATYD
ncbi:hypothetical protein QWZ03_20525 [Chitinimonas viridis]|uniref:LemA family protein n=1 Tax=Chitinimonas viridis TaxID=664880 RepID=A0ABT8BA82_9NEIS|nr:hypothetical protein [Chitinimonas viridis]MDN3579159.1 hypothetical protein [Chitinimonas viridis]